MGTELACYRNDDQTPSVPPAPARPDVVAAWLQGRKATTIRAYASALDDFALYLGAPGAVPAVDRLLALPAGDANALVLGYRADMLNRKLAPATARMRLAALRSVVKLARTLGRVAWAIEVEGPKLEARRDTRGPDKAQFAQLWKAAKKVPGAAKGARDRCLIALLYDLALRRTEVVSLDLEHVDLVDGSLSIIGKGRTERQRLTLPPGTRKALEEWLEFRGGEPGPLFFALDRGAAQTRLSGAGLAWVLDRLGVAAKLPRKLRPHGLRHAAITAALDAGSDIRDVRRFSRHAKLETVLLYDDARSDVAGKVAGIVSKTRK